MKSHDDQRNEEINTIYFANDHQRNRWRDEFLSILESINEIIPNPNEYFYFENGVFDIDRYRKQFDDQLKRDLGRSMNPWFKHGYISGYDFPEVPPMREFSSNWNKFLKSFSGSLFFELNKSGTRSWLAQTIKRDTDLPSVINSKELLEYLKNQWSEYKDHIERFHYKNE